MADLSGRPAPLGIAADLWDVLACPCPEHAPVAPDLSSGRVACTACARTFEVRGGIPVMLLENADGPAGTSSPLSDS
jgi:uncharacterized protein YbaR (Trm112 family)